MNDDGQRGTLEAAQRELCKLRGSGRQLLEALTEAGNNAGKVRKVTALH